MRTLQSLLSRLSGRRPSLASLAPLSGLPMISAQRGVTAPGLIVLPWEGLYFDSEEQPAGIAAEAESYLRTVTATESRTAE